MFSNKEHESSAQYHGQLAPQMTYLVQLTEFCKGSLLADLVTLSLTGREFVVLFNGESPSDGCFNRLMGCTHG